MNIIISNNSNVPIYEQIKNSIIKQILDGDLQENELLPSIRALAKDIRISVMTIKKAYDELEEEGYIITRQGKGSFVVVESNNLILEKAQKDIENYIFEIISIAKKYNIEKNDIINAFNIYYEEGKDNECDWNK